MKIARSSCSEPGGASRSPGEQTLELQRKQTRFSLVKRYVRGQPLAGGEAWYFWTSNERMRPGGGPGWLEATRGDRHVEEPGRAVRVGLTAQLLHRMHKVLKARTEVGRVHSSVDAGNDRRAKGRDHGSVTDRTRSSA